MIRYALRCKDGHRFESWFQSGVAFDSLRASGRVTCPVCDCSEVDKAPMAPRVAGSGAADAAQTGAQPGQNIAPPSDAPTQGMLSAPRNSAVAQAIDRLRRAVEASTEDMGRRFAQEARAIHEGRAPERPIRGEASPDQTRALLADGIPVLPLPFRDPKKSN